MAKRNMLSVIMSPIDIAVFLALYIGTFLCIAVLCVANNFRKTKKAVAGNVLQLVHFSIDDIERDKASNILFKSDLDGYFKRVVTVLFSSSNPRRIDKQYNPSHRVINIPQRPENILELIGFAKTNLAISALGLFCRCIKLIKAEEISLIRAQDPFMLGLTAFVASLCTGIPYTIHVVHNYDVSTRALQRLVFPPFLLRAVEDKVEKLVFKNNLFTTSSYINYRFYAISHGANEATAFSLRTPVQGAHFKELASRRNLKEELGLSGKSMLFYAGRIEKVKFVEDLVVCLNNVRKAARDVVLVVAGDGKLKSRMEAQAEEFGISDSLIFLGKVSHDRLADLYFSSDVILFTHAGITIVEAALSEKPVVSYDHDWACEFLGYNERGLVAQFKDSGELARLTVKLLKDRQLASELGASARAFGLKYFNDKAIKDMEISVLNRFLVKNNSQEQGEFL
ncbi:MAG: glycosyltransferase family 4 protein [Candidatus Omnitrophica bacterium]|nr:glycosyltransferase family 4 protein [Candidatus Omnitrophota bacterium]